MVWQVPTLASASICADCLMSTGRWTVKEGINDQTNPNDVFRFDDTYATLLAVGERVAGDAVARRLRDGADSCAARRPGT